MGLFSFGKKKKDVDEEYFPDSPDRTIEPNFPTGYDPNRFKSIDFIVDYVAKLFRNNLYTIDKLSSIEKKIDKVLQDNYKLQEKNKQLEEKIEHLTQSR